jgi:peptide-methionine (S)-S-oxide reductase
MKTEFATFGAGCFWGVQKSFDDLKGVIETLVGYEGGHLANPTYEQVCDHQTGHTEVVQIRFHPAEISYQELIATFFEIHDPTQMNRQGPDIGEQYRSVIFYHSDKQKELAQKAKKTLDSSGKYNTAIVTAIESAQQFYKAEEYHQKYLAKQGLAVCS